MRETFIEGAVQARSGKRRPMVSSREAIQPDATPHAARNLKRRETGFRYRLTGKRRYNTSYLGAHVHLHGCTRHTATTLLAGAPEHAARARGSAAARAARFICRPRISIVLSLLLQVSARAGRCFVKWMPGSPTCAAASPAPQAATWASGSPTRPAGCPICLCRRAARMRSAARPKAR